MQSNHLDEHGNYSFEEVLGGRELPLPESTAQKVLCMNDQTFYVTVAVNTSDWTSLRVTKLRRPTE